MVQLAHVTVRSSCLDSGKLTTISPLRSLLVAEKLDLIFLQELHHQWQCSNYRAQQEPEQSLSALSSQQPAELDRNQMGTRSFRSVQLKAGVLVQRETLTSSRECSALRKRAGDAPLVVSPVGTAFCKKVREYDSGRVDSNRFGFSIV
jgi:hypothetical protein